MNRKDDILSIKYSTYMILWWKKEKELAIRNAHIYDLELIKEDKKFNLGSEVPLEFQLLDYVKIEYLNEHNYIKYSQNFINDF